MWRTITFGLGAIAGLLFFTENARAEIEPLIELGVYGVQFDEDIQQDTGEVLKLGIVWNDTPLYLWATSESPELRFKGQMMGQAKLDTIGFGVGHQFDKFRIFLEAGMTGVDLEPENHVVREMAMTQLHQNHDYPGRYKPGQQWWRNDVIIPDQWDVEVGDVFGYEANYEVDDTYTGRIGISFEPIRFVQITGAWRWSVADTSLEIWDVGVGIPDKNSIGDDVKCSCWWLEQDTVEFSGWELGISVKW